MPTEYGRNAHCGECGRPRRWAFSKDKWTATYLWDRKAIAQGRGRTKAAARRDFTRRLLGR